MLTYAHTRKIVYILPFVCLNKMQILPLRQKVGAGLMFAFGFLTIVAGASIFAIGFVRDAPTLYTFILATTEQALAITVACCPAFRVFLIRSLGPEIKRTLGRD